MGRRGKAKNHNSNRPQVPLSTDDNNVPSKESYASDDHHLEGAVLDPRRSSPPTELVVLSNRELEFTAHHLKRCQLPRAPPMAQNEGEAATLTSCMESDLLETTAMAAIQDEIAIYSDNVVGPVPVVHRGGNLTTALPLQEHSAPPNMWDGAKDDVRHVCFRSPIAHSNDISEVRKKHGGLPLLLESNCSCCTVM